MNRDRIGGLLGLLFALFILRKSFEIDIGGLHQPGPGLFSFLGAIFLALFSAILLLQSFLIKSGTMGGKARGEKGNPRVVVCLFIALLIYTLIFEYLGFILCTFLLVIFLLWFFEHKKWWIVLITAGIVSSAAYTIFNVLLKSQLPDGVLRVFF